MLFPYVLLLIDEEIGWSLTCLAGRQGAEEKK